MNSFYAIKHLPFLISFCILTIHIILPAQNECGTDEWHHQKMANDVEYAKAYQLMETKILEETSIQSTNRNEVRTIPVVVHVLHKGESVGTGSNISETQILAAIEAANIRWLDEDGPGINMNVQFCLAKTDPQGNPTNGIIRKDASHIENYLTVGMNYDEFPTNEYDLKNLSNWPHHKYYNIWIVHRINGGWAGFANYPQIINFDWDGTVMDYRYMTASSATLAHEFGHGLNLRHTFDGSTDTNCPPNGLCRTQGDGVCDTPPHLKNECSSTSCGTGVFNNSFDNYMSYCGGRNLFTVGQKERVDFALTFTTRAALLNSNVCSVPSCIGSNTTLYIASCDSIDFGIQQDSFVNQYGCDSIITTIYSFLPPPEASFTYVSEGLNVDFSNSSTNSENLSWNFGDGNEAFNENQVTHIYESPGIYEVQLIAENTCKSDTTIQIIDLSVNAVLISGIIQELNLLPNPNKGIFSVELKGHSTNKIVQLLLFDTAGKLIENRSLNYTGYALENYQLKNLASGNYFIQVLMEDKKVKALHFVVQ
jgi:hypothetical protein